MFDPTDLNYPDDFIVSFDGVTVGTILRKVGQGAMGTVYQMRLADGSVCAAKAVRSDVSPKERNEREKQLAAEVTFGFTMGRSPFVMSVFRMVVALPGTETTAKGLLLLCAFVDGGDLEEAMSTKDAVRREQPDYKGDLWERKSTVWPVASVTLQIFMAFEHCHDRGVFHQDFKPANLMLCLDGVAKLCDFGLASFTRRVSFDPWTKSEPEGGQLCAQYIGGTVIYFSPEQIWLKGQLGAQVNSEVSYRELKQKYPVTPAVCDLYAASLVVLEMHSRAAPWFGPYAVTPHEAVRRCAARKPRETVVGLSPEETEHWLVAGLGFAKLKGKVASNNVTSEIIMRMPSMSLKEAKQELKNIPGPAVMGLHNAAKKAMLTLFTSTDYMHENIQNLLERGLSTNVAERPATAKCALKQLMVHALHQHLPEGAKARTFEHSDEEVASTLGGLAKLMVLHGDVPSALTTAAEWIGMSSNAAACSRAQFAYCDLLKRHGDRVNELELSRSTHSNWPSTMLSGKGFPELLANCMWTKGALILEAIDFTDQSALEGGALSRLLQTDGIPTLRTLTLRGCRRVIGVIPSSIRKCTALVSLDLQHANHTGMPLIVSRVILSFVVSH